MSATLATTALATAMLFAGCASAPRNGDQSRNKAVAWEPPASWWEQAAQGKGRLTTADRRVAVDIDGNAAANVWRAKQGIEAASGVRFTLGVLHTPQLNAHTLRRVDHAKVYLTTPMLRKFGDDPDALAAVLGHEIAHYYMNSRKLQNRSEREATVSGLSQVLGTLANFVVPFGGVLVSYGLTGVGRAFDREEEREADRYGTQWAMAAGFDPCGSYRLHAHLQRTTQPGPGFLSTHPGSEERMRFANDMARQAGRPACG